MDETKPSRAEDLAHADEAAERWRAFLDRESASGRGELTGTDGWTLAEATAHLGRWQEWAAARLTAVVAGERLGDLDVDGQNATWYAEDRGIGLDEARQRQQAAWERLRASVEQVPDERWRRMPRLILAANTWEHYDEHLEWRSSGGETG